MNEIFLIKTINNVHFHWMGGIWCRMIFHSNDIESYVSDISRVPGTPIQTVGSATSSASLYWQVLLVAVHRIPCFRSQVERELACVSDVRLSVAREHRPWTSPWTSVCVSSSSCWPAPGQSVRTVVLFSDLLHVLHVLSILHILHVLHIRYYIKGTAQSQDNFKISLVFFPLVFLHGHHIVSLPVSRPFYIFGLNLWYCI